MMGSQFTITCLLVVIFTLLARTQAMQLPPRVSAPVPEVRVTEGQKNVVLECHLDIGDDPIQYRWLKNHLWVTGSLGHAYRGRRQLLLAMHPIRKEHSGKYTCEAKNDAGTHTVVISVIVESSYPSAMPANVAPPPTTDQSLVELAASLSDVLAESDCLCDISFLLHASPDAPHDLISVQANFINTIADTLISDRIRVSVMSYSDYVDLRLPFSNGTNSCALKAALQNVNHKQWAPDMHFILRDLLKKFRKSRSACKVLFLPIIGSAGQKGIDLIGAQHLQKAGVKIFVLEVTPEAIPGVAELASKRGDGKPYHWRVPLDIWQSIVIYMEYMVEELQGCQSEGLDVPGVCVADGEECTHNDQCRGPGMGCLQGICLSLECNVDPTKPGCCAVPGRFWCGDVTRNCTSSHSYCDGRVHCMNGRDEDKCWHSRCPASRAVQCHSTTLCLSLSELCDGHIHCPAGEDEDPKFCDQFPCPSERSFKCRSGRCISNDKVCDGVFMDCEEGEDETLTYCYGSHSCSGNKSFKCDYGVCIENSAVCDGSYNCLDAADEVMCGLTTCPVARPYKCANGQCIQMDLVCNGHRDGCSDGSDELNCSNFTCPLERSLKCLNGRCIDNWLACDNNDDCGDGTDELECPDLPTYRTSPQAPSNYPSFTTQRTAPKVICKSGQFTCKNGACISEERVCDGRVNCLDGDDEVGCAEMECPENRPHRCPGSQACVNAVVCDGVTDCPDGSDEADCPPTVTEGMEVEISSPPSNRENDPSSTTPRTEIEHEGPNYVDYEGNYEYDEEDSYNYDDNEGDSGNYDYTGSEYDPLPERQPEPEHDDYGDRDNHADGHHGDHNRNKPEDHGNNPDGHHGDNPEDHDNHGNHQGDNDWNKPSGNSDDDGTMTVLENDDISPAASSDQLSAGSVVSCGHTALALAALSWLAVRHTVC